jgi:hypothetical protein
MLRGIGPNEILRQHLVLDEVVYADNGKHDLVSQLHGIDVLPALKAFVCQSGPSKPVQKSFWACSLVSAVARPEHTSGAGLRKQRFSDAHW